MNFRKFPFFWFAGHQIGLIIFSIFHLFYCLNTNNPNNAIAGFLVGFSVHFSLAVSWSLIGWSTTFIIWAIALSIGVTSWLTSLILIASLHHWSMGGFLGAAILWPIIVFYKFQQLGTIAEPDKKVTSLVEHILLLIIAFGRAIIKFPLSKISKKKTKTQ
jgi:hypothetical protein